MSEKVMITGAKRWAERCKTHAGEEVQNGVSYVCYLLYKLAQLEAENEALMEYVPAHVLREWEHGRTLLTGED